MYICKCGSQDMFLGEKGYNTGMYCSACGKWQKWMSKDEIRLFKQKQKESWKDPPEEVTQRDYLISSHSSKDKLIIDRLREFVDFLDSQIDEQLTRDTLSTEDAISKCSYAHAYEKNKNAILNIIAGRDWNDNRE